MKLPALVMNAVVAIVAGYGLMVAAVALGQRALIYHPWAPRSDPPPEFQAIALPLPAGEMTAWYRPAMARRPTIVFFDGNGGALAGAARFTKGLADAGYGLLLVSYPGYDGNPGRPTEDSLYATGRAALAWLDRRGAAVPVLLGYSLGSAVATQMAAEHPSRALILLAPFASMARMAAIRMPFMPTRRLLLDRYDSIAKIGGIHVPLLVVHGDADTVVPMAEGHRLYDAANAPKRFVVRHGGTHLLDMAPIVPEIDAFLAQP